MLSKDFLNKQILQRKGIDYLVKLDRFWNHFYKKYKESEQSGLGYFLDIYCQENCINLIDMKMYLRFFIYKNNKDIDKEFEDIVGPWFLVNNEDINKYEKLQWLMDFDLFDLTEKMYREREELNQWFFDKIFDSLSK